MKTGFESILTRRLANETLQRAEDVHKINETAWLACLWAFVGIGVGAGIGMPLDVFYGWSTGWAMGLALAIGAWPLWRWVVDRLGRSLQHLVAGLGDLQAASVGLYLHKQALDTSTPSGRAMFGMLAIFAEFERELIQERVRAGMKVAKAEQAAGKERLHPNGRVKKAIGRPRVSPETEAQIRSMRAEGFGMTAISKALSVGGSTVKRVLDSQ